MAECDEQMYLFNWVAFARNTIPEIDLLFHVPNGGSRDKREAARLKAQGVRAGVPDLCLPVPSGEYHGLFIELKVGKNKTSKEQEEWLGKLAGQGYKTAVCYGWEAAMHEILTYLGKEA